MFLSRFSTVSTALLLGIALAADVEAQSEDTPPHLREIVWDEDQITPEAYVMLDDSTALVMALPLHLDRGLSWRRRREQRHWERCIGGHPELTALIPVRFYERFYGRPGMDIDQQDYLPLQYYVGWDDRPLVCMDTDRYTYRDKSDDLWEAYPGDTLAVVAIETAFGSCMPDIVRSDDCGAPEIPEIIERFTNEHGVEVIGVSVRYIDGNENTEPAPDAHAIGPFYMVKLPSSRYPFVPFFPMRIAGDKEEEAYLRPNEVDVLRHILHTVYVYECPGNCR